MKRREAKFVRASSGLSPERIKAALPVHASVPRAAGRPVPPRRQQSEPAPHERRRKQL
jgi:hypothetical protein